jgi:hypothetical protein
MLMRLQSRIMVNISVGSGYSQTMLPYKCKDGKLKDMPVYEYLDRLIDDTMDRLMNITSGIWPILSKYVHTFDDFRYNRNNKIFREFVRKLIRER